MLRPGRIAIKRDITISPDNVLRYSYPAVNMFMLRCMFFDDVITPSLYADHYDGSPVLPTPVYAGHHAFKDDLPCLLRCDYMHILIKNANALGVAYNHSIGY